MSFPLFIARRYLFAPRRVGFIHLISAISAGGVAVACLALIVTLSVFNGFRELIGGLYTAMDPELVVLPAKNKLVDAENPTIKAISSDADVLSATPCLMQEALILPKGKPLVFTLKGVADNYSSTLDIDSILVGDVNGGLTLSRAEVPYGTPGIGLAAAMGNIDFGTPFIYAPRRGERINLANPAENFAFDKIYASGQAFQVHQRKYDEHIMLVPLKFAQDIFEQEGKISSLELRLRVSPDAIPRVKERLRKLAGADFKILDRTEQQEDTFRIMNIEKFVAYIFLTFIALIASFNIIGAVSMLIIEKRNDIATLRTMGATTRHIRRIFFYEGMLISIVGALTGVILGVIICILQEHFGLLRLGSAEGNFIIDAYPVSVKITDVLLVFATAVITGVLSVWYPIHFLTLKK